MTEDHYFTAQPASADERRLIPVALGGLDLEVETATGIFSPGHVDLGTRVLLAQVPEPRGRVLDIGCGWGPIALDAALRGADDVTAIDVNERALDLLRRNADRIGRHHALAPVAAMRPEEVPAEATFDTIWSNPPIRIGKAALHELLATWLPRLAPGGEAFLVVQRNLGADSLARWLADQGWGTVDKVGSSKGFRVLRVTA
ncbi:class I SAM-dependent methyltransferase [Demequina lignilytica]|uniref:Methyltransferase n=1 Tax=Demequina lignilytica TaxID=3051663 RepID=A0AB35MJK7_9MICO|nr:methyltransferase [Demequina sp. SYSU T0a273]MDN4483987.1 methyltransferase [Demequina sp. SYSU T0a273]